MTLAEAGEIFAYWEQDPPVHLMVQAIARILGWTPPPAPAHLADIAAAPPPGLRVAGDGALGMPAPVLDPGALRRRNRARALGADGGIPAQSEDSRDGPGRGLSEDASELRRARADVL